LPEFFVNSDVTWSEDCPSSPNPFSHEGRRGWGMRGESSLCVTSAIAFACGGLDRNLL